MGIIKYFFDYLCILGVKGRDSWFKIIVFDFFMMMKIVLIENKIFFIKIKSKVEYIM